VGEGVLVRRLERRQHTDRADAVCEGPDEGVDHLSQPFRAERLLSCDLVVDLFDVLEPGPAQGVHGRDLFLLLFRQRPVDGLHVAEVDPDVELAEPDVAPAADRPLIRGDQVSQEPLKLLLGDAGDKSYPIDPRLANGSQELGEVRPRFRQGLLVADDTIVDQKKGRLLLVQEEFRELEVRGLDVFLHLWVLVRVQPHAGDCTAQVCDNVMDFAVRFDCERFHRHLQASPVVGGESIGPPHFVGRLSRQAVRVQAEFGLCQPLEHRNRTGMPDSSEGLDESLVPHVVHPEEGKGPDHGSQVLCKVCYLVHPRDFDDPELVVHILQFEELPEQVDRFRILEPDERLEDLHLDLPIVTVYEWPKLGNQVVGTEPSDQADQADERRAPASRDLLFGNLGHAVLEDRQQIEQVLVSFRLLPIEVEVERLGHDVRADGCEKGLGHPILLVPPFVEGGKRFGEEGGQSESLKVILGGVNDGGISLVLDMPL